MQMKNLNLLPLVFSFYLKEFLNNYLQKNDKINHNDCKIDLKFKNDLLINNKKLSGILAESISNGGKESVVIVGIGLNVNNTFKTNKDFSDLFISLHDKLDFDFNLEEVEELLVKFLFTKIRNFCDSNDMLCNSNFISEINNNLVYIDQKVKIINKKGNNLIIINKFK